MASEAVSVCLDKDEIEKISDIAVRELGEGDILLAKASRAIGAERIVEKIKQKLEVKG